MKAVHADVMARGWSESLGAFRQHHESDTLNASVLLIPVMGFLPADRPAPRNEERSWNRDQVPFQNHRRPLRGSGHLPAGELG